MVYIDTSALVPAFIREPKTGAVLAWLESTENRLTISEWGITEFASAMAIKIRTGQIGAGLAEQAWQRFSDFADKHCVVAVPTRAEFRRAGELARDAMLDLRAGDAVHLAIAEAVQVDALLTLDKAMVESAKAIGLNAVTV
ncbi:MAG: type II toxin-antitoxin system VapC family toxin [Betaproteobacteria bacterium]